MNAFKKIIAPLVILGVSGLSLFGFSGSASAACWQYTGDTMSTSTTPVFNNICGVPFGTGNESDFVRIRPNTGDDMSTANNADYTDALTAACASGSSYDVHTYIHNDASQDFNNNGSGSSVAHDVQLAMTAALGTTNNNFTFGSTVSASNAASVHDTATLNCGSKQVKLSLVAGSVHVYSKPYGWLMLNDNAVNGTTKLGSPTLGSGDQWGCWDYRTIVVYEVKVTEIPPTPPVSTLQCKINDNDFTFDQKNRKVSLKVTPSVTNATVTGYKIDWGDNTTAATTQSASHTYGSNVTTATITASFTAKLADGTTQTKSSADCVKTVSFTTTPVVTPPVTPPVTPTAPTVLVNTGAGSVIGLFAATSAVGAIAYRWFLGRRLGSN